MKDSKNNTIESEVRGYSRSFPTTFSHAKGPFLYSADNKRYLDFFSGAGALNYGHNEPTLKQAVLEYISSNGLVHGLDMSSTIRDEFLKTFNDLILKPRNMDYKIQFAGPTGTNAVEAAIRLARKVTGRSLILSCTNGYHGMTLGSLALTANEYYRDDNAILQQNVTFVPFDGYMGKDVDTIDYLEKLLNDPSSGMDKPAAIILETIQGEGGINVASYEWLQRLRDLTKEHGILMIVDDIQVGCGRTGTFFSFEDAEIVPDIVLLSKSLSGFGLPLSAVLIKPEYDQWKPGEHTGTFRSNSLALLTAMTAFSTFWESPSFELELETKARLINVSLSKIKQHYPNTIKDIRGRGMIWGIEFSDKDMAGRVQKEAHKRNMIVETSGAHDHVLKLLPPLTINNVHLQEGLKIIDECIYECYNQEYSHRDEPFFNEESSKAVLKEAKKNDR